MNEQREKKKRRARQIAAIIAIVLLVGMYIITFISALLATPQSSGLFRACLILTVFIPVVCWVAVWLIGIFTDRQNFASARILNSDEESREEMERAAAEFIRRTENGDSDGNDSGNEDISSDKA